MLDCVRLCYNFILLHIYKKYNENKNRRLHSVRRYTSGTVGNHSRANSFLYWIFASQNYSVSAPLRSAQNRRPPDVVRPITCSFFYELNLLFVFSPNHISIFHFSKTSLSFLIFQIRKLYILTCTLITYIFCLILLGYNKEKEFASKEDIL